MKKFDAKTLLTLIFAIIFAISFYLFFKPVDIPGFFTYFTAFVLLPSAIVYWILGKIKTKIKIRERKPEEIEKGE